MAIAQRQGGPQQAFMTTQGMGRGGPSGLADVLEVLLDKGLVIDAFVRVSLVGIELLTIDARVVVASVDTYLRFAEAVNRLDLLQANNSQTLGEVLGGGRGSGERTDGKSRALSPSPRREEPVGNGAAAASDDADAENRPAPVDGEQETTSPDSGGTAGDEDRGLLSRIKERGQVF